MIFNPYDLAATYAETVQQTVSALPWALPQPQDNAMIVALLLLSVCINMLAWRRKGVFYSQLMCLINTRRARSFDATTVYFPWIKPLLVCQIFLYFGLSVFYATDDAPALHLAHPDAQVALHLGIAVLVLLGWSLIQSAWVNWFCYLFGQSERQIIMNRAYIASLVVLSPLAMRLFICILLGGIASHTALILLAALFILLQTAFIFNGVKIFYEGLGSLFLIIAYLCTLEIAPILVLWAKLTTQ